MERMIINPESRTIPCASIECNNLVQLSEYQLDYIKSKGEYVVVTCKCGKCFEVEAEKDVN